MTKYQVVKQDFSNGENVVSSLVDALPDNEPIQRLW